MKPRSATWSWSGVRLDDRYEVVAELLQGGMGAVYRGIDLRTGKHVAIKTLHATDATESWAAARFDREVENLRKVNAPGVVRLLHHGTIEGRRYLVMELADGPDVSAVLMDGALPVHTAVEIAAQLAEALVALHELGVVHRDVKPANVVLHRYPSQIDAKLVDFGISVEPGRSSAARITADGMSVGTPHYSPPEVLLGRVLGPWVDIYSLGVMLHEMLTGVAPFDGENIGAVIRNVMRSRPRDLEEVREEVPKEIAELVRQMMERDVMKRPRSADAVLDVLTPYRLDDDFVFESGVRPAMRPKDTVPPTRTLASTMPPPPELEEEFS